MKPAFGGRHHPHKKIKIDVLLKETPDDNNIDDANANVSPIAATANDASTVAANDDKTSTDDKNSTVAADDDNASTLAADDDNKFKNWEKGNWCWLVLKKQKQQPKKCTRKYKTNCMRCCIPSC